MTTYAATCFLTAATLTRYYAPLTIRHPRDGAA